MEKTGQEILIDYIKEDAQDSEKSMQNLIFKDDFSKEDEEKISQKAAEHYEIGRASCRERV